MSWELIVFAIFYLGGLYFLGAALCLLFAHDDAQQEPVFRLGHTMWLCAGCHKAYDHPVQRCPQGHAVIEVAAWTPEPEPDFEGRHHPYATVPMTPVGDVSRQIQR